MLRRMLSDTRERLPNIQAVVTMGLPKTLSDSLIAKLNSACDAFSRVCGHECEELGWCEACWIAAGSGRMEACDEPGAGKIANNVS